MELFFAWIVFAIIVGAIGSNRNIGFGLAFFLSLILSPIIGLIITLFSETKSTIEARNRSIQLQEEQKNILSEISKSKTSTEIIEELSKLNNLKNSGAINDEEFERLKSDLMSNDKTQNSDPNTVYMDEVEVKNDKSDNTTAFIGIMLLIIIIIFIWGLND